MRASLSCVGVHNSCNDISRHSQNYQIKGNTEEKQNIQLRNVLREQIITCAATKNKQLLQILSRHGEISGGKRRSSDMQQRHFVSAKMESVVRLGFPSEY